jgi:hypothetical protein
MRPQPRPARKAALAGDDELGIVKRCGIRPQAALRVSSSEAPDSLGLVSANSLQERARAFPLMFEVEARQRSSFYACVR